MKYNTIGAALILFVIPALALAQQGDPLEAANAVDACNGNAVISAVWQDDGRLAVRCPPGSAEGTSAGVGATNFAIPLLLLIVGAAAVGGGGSTSSTN